MRMHATLVDSSRYVRESMRQPYPWQPTVNKHGRWVSIEHQRSSDEAEYLCHDHPFLGWIPGYDLWFHAASRSHSGRSMFARWRYMR